MGSLTIVLCLALVVVSVAAYPALPQYGGQLAQAVYQQVAALPTYEEPPYEERNYKVFYSVKDDPSYNYQTRNEEKNGKTVTGQYTVLEPTGELRVVNYIADDNGFRADVQNQAGYAPAYGNGRGSGHAADHGASGHGAVYSASVPVNIALPAQKYNN